MIALYDQDQRKDIEYPDMRREVTPEVVRHTKARGVRYLTVDASPKNKEQPPRNAGSGQMGFLRSAFLYKAKKKLDNLWVKMNSNLRTDMVDYLLYRPLLTIGPV